MRFSSRCRPIRRSARISRPRCSARARFLRPDSEGRVVLSERLRAIARPARTRRRSSVMGTSFRSGSRAGSRRISRRPKLECAHCGPNSARGGASRRNGSTGMNAGRGERHTRRWRTGSPHSRAARRSARSAERQSRRPLSRRHLRRRRLYARPAGARRARDRARPRSAARSPPASRSSAASQGRLTLVEGRFGDLDALARELGARGARRRRARHRRLLDAARRGRARLLAAPRRAARHAHGRRRAAAPPTSCSRTTKRRSPTSSIISARSAPRAASRAPSSPTAPTAPYVSTRQLAEMIARVAPARPGELTHPATRAFQALRIAVNDELGQLLRRPRRGERALAPGGRLAVVTFHSLEDRIVKQFFARRSGRGRRPRACCRASRRRRADLPRRRRPADPARARRNSPTIRARARPNCASASAPARRRGGRDAAIAGVDALAAARREERLMWRFLHVIAIGALIGSAVYVYSASNTRRFTPPSRSSKRAT